MNFDFIIICTSCFLNVVAEQANIDGCVMRNTLVLSTIVLWRQSNLLSVVSNKKYMRQFWYICLPIKIKEGKYYLTKCTLTKVLDTELVSRYELQYSILHAEPYVIQPAVLTTLYCLILKIACWVSWNIYMLVICDNIKNYTTYL